MDADIKKRAAHRTKIIEGQIRGLQKLIDNEEYCMDIMTQNLAIQRSLASLNKLILENHITTHVVQMLSSGDEKAEAQALSELKRLYELNNVRGQNN